MNWGDRVKFFRGKLNQSEFAERGECSLSYVRSVENGKRSPTLKSLELILRGVGVSMAEFFESKVPNKYADPTHQDLHEYLQIILESSADQALCVKTMIENAYEAVIHSARDEPKKETKHRRKAGIA